MALRYAINGFGRIGRLVYRFASEVPEFEAVAVNDLTDARTLAHLLKYDSVHGRYDADIEHGEGTMTIDGNTVRVLSEKDPAVLPWGELDVDVVIESTGKFRAREGASKHLAAGAPKVMI